jgi:hypothetical protein
MPSAHKHPVKNFRPPPELYERAKEAVAEVGTDMNAYLISCLRWVTGETDEPPMRPDGKPGR